MKPFAFARTLSLLCLVGFALPIACGDDETNPASTAAGGDGAGGDTSVGGLNDSVAGGAAGASMGLPPGISTTPKTQTCGGATCTSSSVLGAVFVDPCCAGDGCGLDTSFLGLLGAPFEDSCQPKQQPGDADEACPTTADATIPVTFQGKQTMLPVNGFAGCCRPNGMCGVLANDVISPVLAKVASLDLGCVDAAPFFPGKTIGTCGSGGSGAGGAGGAGSGSSAAGAAGAAGMAGAATGGAPVIAP